MKSQVMAFVNKVMEEQRAEQQRIAAEGTVATDPNAEEVPDQQLNVGELLTAARLDGETNEEYTERRKFSKRYVKYVKQGRTVWDSSTQATYVKQTA